MYFQNRIQKKNASMLTALCVPMLSMGLFSGSANASEDLSMSGNIGVFSKYVLRGIHSGGGESAGPALQGGFDTEHSSGMYAGYWGSSLGYADEAGEAGYENDFYFGYSGETSGFSYSAGLIYYKYLQISDSDAPELSLGAGYGPVSLGVLYLLDDVAWGNTGDTYITLDYETDLPKDFSASVSLGYYMYEDSGEFIESSELDSGFRHLNVTLSHPIGKTGADMSITGIYGGVDRDDNDQGVTAVLGVSYGFDI